MLFSRRVTADREEQDNEILENLGYIHEFYCEDLDNYEYYREQIKQYHLGYIKEVNNETVHIEIHASIVNPASLFENITDEFIVSQLLCIYQCRHRSCKCSLQAQ